MKRWLKRYGIFLIAMYCWLLVPFALPNFGLAEETVYLPPADKDPFVGTWKTNRDLSRPKLSKREASYIRTMLREGDELLFSSSMENFKTSEHHFRMRCDGQWYNVPTPDQSMLCLYASSNVVVGASIDPNHKVSYWTREVSADGQQMRITAYKDKARTKIESISVLDRIK
ncbi:MAG: hypothetical protein HY313_11630 [Acidobacteria bacterium]|nr:hypothetical protein [Acidobacteriota bacterium]